AGARAETGRVVGYYIQWGIYGRGYTVKNVETSGSADKLTVINYAFGKVAPDADGNVVCVSGDAWADYQKPWSADESVTGKEVPWSAPLRGNFQQLKALKELHPGLKVLMSLGGWTWSRDFSDAALTKESRQKFVSSCIDLFINGNLPDTDPGAGAGVFDGIDIDWEWPGSEGNAGNVIRPEDKQNYTKLLQEFRKQLHAYGRESGEDYLLTAFLPASAAKIDSGFEVPDIFGPLSFATVQGYDFHGTWESTTNHQSNLYTSPSDPSNPRYSDDAVVNEYLSRGAPPKELVVGVPFYSRGWTGVAPANSGLYQTAAGPAPGTFEAGVDDYKAVKERLASGFTRHADNAAGAAWLFDGSTFWTFDDPPVMKAKADYVRRNGLGGIMFWELSGDTPTGELIAAIADGLS
ncbi:MAG TPA: glycoside hydrolase family 18 protein, partial [Gaiellaceae bacterium]|nr:glycoside hydrolase family 18 protein [Gaiellaceae bacterium]